MMMESTLKKTFLRLWPFLLLFVLTLIFFWKPVFTGQVFSIGRLYYPEKYLAIKTWLSGDTPLWNPYIYTGYPLLGSLKSGAVYPLNIILLLPLPFTYLMTWYIVLHSLLAAGFMFVLGRDLGFGRLASLISAITYAFGGYILGQLPQYDTFQVLAWAPLAFFLLNRFLRTARLSYALLAGVPIGIQTHTQMAVYLFVGLAIFAVYGIWALPKEHSAKRFAKLVMGLLACASVAVGLSAVQMLPAQELTNLSRRAGGIPYDGFGLGSSLPRDFLTLIFPRLFWIPGPSLFWTPGTPGPQPYFTETYLYLGLLPLIFFVVGLKAGLPRRLIILMTIIAVVSILLALGRNTILLKGMFHVPIFNLFRHHDRWLILTHFALSLLAGFGARAFLASPQGTGRNIWQRNFTFLVIGSLLWLLLVPLLLWPGAVFGALSKVSSVLLGRAPEFMSDIAEGKLDLRTNLIIFAAICTLGLTILQLYRSRIISLRVFSILLIVFVFGELFSFNSYINPVRDASYLSTPSASIKFLKTQGEHLFRVFSANVNRDNTDASLHLYISALGEVYGISSVTGWAGLDIQRYWDFLYNTMEKESKKGADYFLDAKMAGLLNAEFVIAGDDIAIDGLTPVFRTQGRIVNHNQEDINYKLLIYRNSYVLPRAFLVHRAQYVERPSEILSILRSPGFDPARTVLLEDPVAPKVDLSLERATESTVEIPGYSSRKVLAITRSSEAGYLVLSDMYYPGWRVRVDGAPAPLYRAHYLIRAVYLQAGEHEVEFIYDPLSFKVGLIITLGTLLGLLTYLVYEFQRKASS